PLLSDESRQEFLENLHKEGLIKKLYNNNGFLSVQQPEASPAVNGNYTESQHRADDFKDQLPPYIRPDKFSRAPVRGNMNQGSWSPLPPCWEEQYDHVTRRNYFVDHNTRTTTWNRPPLIETEEEKEGRLQEYERTVRPL